MIDSTFFKTEILDKKQSAYIAFVSSWCAPSQLETQVFKELKDKYQNQIIIDTIDIDSAPDLAKQYNIHCLPTVLAIENGELFEAICCFQSKEELEESVTYYLKEREKAEKKDKDKPASQNL